MSLRILITGGTFDKDYDAVNGRLFFRDSHVTEMLRLGKCGLNVATQTLMMLDSLDMKPQDREVILAACREAPEDRLLITHGTDTMEVTARFLGEKKLPKTVVLTGAMIPYAFGSSDGLFNLGSAIAFCQSLPHGVYVAMNGRAFNWDDVAKNRQTGEFKTLNR
jgi:L-asparaginase